MTAAQTGMPWHSEEPRRQNWATPMPLFREIERRHGGGGFNLDACAEEWNAKCDRFFTEHDDGLAMPWRLLDGTPGRVWCNPPYDDIGSWIRKGFSEVLCGNAERVVFLIPARVDQPWFHGYVRAGATVYFMVGRVQFAAPEGSEDEKKQGSFESSMIVVFDRPIETADFRGGAR